MWRKLISSLQRISAKISQRRCKQLLFHLKIASNIHNQKGFGAVSWLAVFATNEKQTATQPRPDFLVSCFCCQLPSLVLLTLWTKVHAKTNMNSMSWSSARRRHWQWPPEMSHPINCDMIPGGRHGADMFPWLHIWRCTYQRFRGETIELRRSRWDDRVSEAWSSDYLHIHILGE